MSMFGSFLQWIGLIAPRRIRPKPGAPGSRIPPIPAGYELVPRKKRSTPRGGAWVRAYRVKRKKRNRTAKRSRRINRMGR